MSVGFQLCQPRKTSLQVEQNGTELGCLTPRAFALNMTLTKRKNWESYHTKWTRAQFSINFHFGNVLFDRPSRPDTLYFLHNLYRFPG